MPSSAAVRARMSRQKRRDTKAEMLVRRELHARGIRFRVDVKLENGLRTRGDIVWRGLKLVVFVDGCFWHRSRSTNRCSAAEAVLDGTARLERRGATAITNQIVCASGELMSVPVAELSGQPALGSPCSR